MISIIICSRSSDIPMELKQNIADTIGVEYELVVIDNSANKYSIFSAYNEGVRRAKGDMLCFMHEDILFRTEGWGNLVYDHFGRNKEMGLLGVIGGHYLPDMPASWFTTTVASGRVLQVNGQKVEDIKWWQYKKDGESTIEVATVDGLWFCMPRVMMDRVKFDEKTFHHFHCYDSDICMQIMNVGMQVRVAFDILIEHRSIGLLTPIFFEQRDIWYEKWKAKLPVVKGVELTDNEINTIAMMAQRVNDTCVEACATREALRKVRQSHAYRLGKRLLKPLQWIKKSMKK